MSLSLTDQRPDPMLARTIGAALRWVGLLGLFVAYEIHLHALAYPIPAIISLGVFFAGCALHRLGRFTLSQSAIMVLTLLAAGTGVAGALHVLDGQGLNERGFLVAKLVVQLGIVGAFLILGTQYTLRWLLGAAAWVCVPVAALAVLVSFVGDIGPWSLVKDRAASVFHDPNYAGAIFGFGVIWHCLRRSRQSTGRLIAASTCAIALVLSYSKGALVGTGLALVWLSLLRFPYAALPVLVSTAALGAVALPWLLSILDEYMPMLRLGMGLNLRGAYWWATLVEIARAPLWVHSHADLLAITERVGKGHSSIHNYYLEMAYLHGLPMLLAILSVLTTAVWRYLRRRDEVSTVLVYFCIVANNFTFSLGSVGLLPVLFTCAALIPYVSGRYGRADRFLAWHRRRAQGAMPIGWSSRRDR